MARRDYRSLAEALGVRGRASGDELRSRCPVHEGRDLNFSVNVRTGQWSCFSQCGGGNFVRLVSLVLGSSMTQALDWVSENDTTAYEEPTQSLPLVVVGPPLWLAQYQIASTNELPQWWFERGFDWADARRWDVRWDARAQQLLLPYLWRGDLVGTIARNMTRRPKYQNSPQLAKSRMLFGPSDLRASIVLVEGALDALWFAKHGYNAAALLGSSVSEEQLLLLSHAPEVTLAMDADEAGRVAQQEAIERFQKAGRWDVREATYPEGRKDAQECTSVELASVVAERRIATGGYVAEHR